MILDDILAGKRLEVARRKRVRPLPPLPSTLGQHRRFGQALRQPGVAFIAGKGSAPLGCVSPVIVIKLAVASWPMNF